MHVRFSMSEMKSSKPVNRLWFKDIGDEVELFGDYLKRKLTVINIRDDGYYDLARNGRLEVTASKCHEVK